VTARTPDMTAFEAVLRQYAIAHDEHAEREQLMRLRGMTDEAEQEHTAAVVALRGYVEELHCPETRP